MVEGDTIATAGYIMEQNHPDHVWLASRFFELAVQGSIPACLELVEELVLPREVRVYPPRRETVIGALYKGGVP